MLEPCQASSCLGSFWGRPAFMGNSVFGRLRVFFSSSGSAIGLSARITPDLRACFRALARVYRTKDFVRASRTVVPVYGEKTLESSVTTYVTMNAGWCQPPGARNLFWPARILAVGCTHLH